MQLSELLNILLGSGLLATLVALFTLRATVRKANAEAEQANATAEGIRMDNAEHATRVLVQNIVNPLKQELDETRKYLDAARREMSRLRKAIDTANSCRHHDDCPVLHGLREQSKNNNLQQGILREQLQGFTRRQPKRFTQKQQPGQQQPNTYGDHDTLDNTSPKP